VPIEQVHSVVQYIALAIEVVGAVVILGAVVVASSTFVTVGRRTGDWREGYHSFRSNLGRGILLGLELLVGADIIATITAPLTFSSVGLLALIVVIRTFLSFALETEMEGRFPWRRAQATESGKDRR
jgi:uncharacterized membrane protein